MTQITTKEAKLIQKAIREDDEYFFKHVLGVDPWAKQKEIFNAVMNHPVVAVRSCNGVGKTWTGARVVLRWEYAFDNAIAITTAPTYRQVVDAMWGEIHTAHYESKIPLGGQLNKTELQIGPKWYAKGMSTNKSDNFQGYHEENILFVVDEAPGVEESIFTAIDGNLTSANAHLLMTGNPTSITGRFYRAFKLPHVYKIHISCFDTPNFILNGITTMADLEKVGDRTDIVNFYPHLIQPKWAYEKLLEWGEESPLFQARVLGEFPEQGDKSLIPLNWIDKAKSEERQRTVLAMLNKNSLRYYGVDVARYGTDASAVIGRMDDYVYLIDQIWKLDTTELGVKNYQLDLTKPGRWSIDTSGLGVGTFDTMRHQLRVDTLGNNKYHFGIGYSLFDSNSSKKAINSAKFVNLRAEMYWNLREAFQHNRIYIPDHEELIYQLSSIEFFIASDGRIQIEDKDKIKKKIGRSPDLADALALAYSGYMNHNNEMIEGEELNLYDKFNN